MVKEIFSLKSKDEVATPLHCVEWKADGDAKPVGVLQLVHGMIEYIERYEEFADYMTQKGFVVIGHDHIGPDVTMCEDMLSVYQYGKKKFPDVPYFILGHSMGSFMLRRFLAVYNDRLKGLSGAIIVGTGTTPNAVIHIARFVLKVTALFHGWDYKSKGVLQATITSSIWTVQFLKTAGCRRMSGA